MTDLKDRFDAAYYKVSDAECRWVFLCTCGPDRLKPDAEEKLRDALFDLTTGEQDPSLCDEVSEALARLEALEAANARLRQIALEYRDVLRRAYTGPDKHCGYYTAKDYRFKKQNIPPALERIRAALRETDSGLSTEGDIEQ